MIVHQVTQGTPEWHQLRCGVITASEVDTVMSRTGGLTPQQKLYVDAILAGASTQAALETSGYKKAPSADAVVKALKGEPVVLEWSEAAKNYAFKLAVERISGMPLGDDGYVVWQAVRGQALEARASERMEELLGDMILPGGFITTDDMKFGCSPDGLLKQEGDYFAEGCEFKAYLAPTKLRAILIEHDFSVVHGQTQLCLAITGAKVWHYGLLVPQLEDAGRAFTYRRFDNDEDFQARMWRDLLDFDRLVEEYRAKLLDGEKDPRVESSTSTVAVSAPEADPPAAAPDTQELALAPVPEPAPEPVVEPPVATDALPPSDPPAGAEPTLQDPPAESLPSEEPPPRAINPDIPPIGGVGEPAVEWKPEDAQIVLPIGMLNARVGVGFQVNEVFIREALGLEVLRREKRTTYFDWRTFRSNLIDYLQRLK